jgi:hypothetical protein
MNHKFNSANPFPSDFYLKSLQKRFLPVVFHKRSLQPRVIPGPQSLCGRYPLPPLHPAFCHERAALIQRNLWHASVCQVAIAGEKVGVYFLVCVAQNRKQKQLPMDVVLSGCDE